MLLSNYIILIDMEEIRIVFVKYSKLEVISLVKFRV